MDYLIIDTNVPLKAANMHPEDELDRQCSLACLNFIQSLMNSKNVVVLDEGREILKEYEKHIETQGESTVASQFLMWLYRNLMTDQVNLCKITKIGDNMYDEFPNTPELEKFDRSDRKFVALAKAHPAHPSIYNGSDTDWWDFRDALEREGVHIVFLNKEYMQRKSKGIR